MTWFGIGKKDAPAVEVVAIPLFPLGAVLFPGGTLTLKVFEKRYLDMAADCMKRQSRFGICLIESGKEVAEKPGEAAQPHRIGTLAEIVDWDMERLGILQLGVRGGRRFRILSAQADGDGLLHGETELLAEPEPVAVPEALHGLLPILEKVAADVGPEKMPPPHAWHDAAWVGYRLVEVLPVQPLAKQKLLELDDPVARLEIVFKYLAQRGLVK